MIRLDLSLDEPSAHTDMIPNFTPHHLPILNSLPLPIALTVAIDFANVAMGAHKYVEELAKRKQSVSQ